ncbi:hypothetical protein IQ07DRAFT_574305 [Pyrenochaeta sp. DS3sAY3a]|nr:hypothetical protein IQ07DRAFT_574305 [Pyrenochaeta sp. DS3sAY3a]
MSSDQSIGSPFTLASLSKPIASTDGRLHAAGVCSISGIKKRKRTEVVVGLGGEGVSLYSLQNPQLVTSYALPPSATLSSAPYSIYRKGSSKTPTQRFTYVSLAGSASTDKPQIVCFHEKILGDQAETVKTSYLTAPPAQVLSIDSLPVARGGSARETTHDILATFDNGDVICLSADLTEVRWVANLTSLISSGESHIDIENVTTATAKAVTRGLLRNRGDIAAILNPSSDESSDILDLTQVMCVIGRGHDGSWTLSLLQVQPRSADLPVNHLSPLKQLLSWTLPKSSKVPPSTTSPPQFSLHASTGTVHILADGVMVSYDLSGTVPRLNAELAVPGAKIDSFLRTSQDTLFTSSNSTCRVFDTKFSSLQALLVLDSASNSSENTSPSKKRKHAQTPAKDSTQGALDLVAYYADISLIVAARGNDLVGMQFGGISTRKRVKVDGTLLIDAIGKGIVLTSEPVAAYDIEKWQSRKEKLERYAAKDKVAKFEENLAADLGIQLESSVAESNQGNEINGDSLMNGTSSKNANSDAATTNEIDGEPAEDDLPRWKSIKGQSNSKLQQNRRYALFALSKIFSWTESVIESDATSTTERTRGSLKVEFFPPNVFQWLLHTGQVTKESIRRSILDESPSMAQSVANIRDGDIVKALVDFDPDLHILSAVLNHSHFLPVAEVVQAIKVLIRSIEDVPEDSDATKLLTNGATGSDDEMEVDITSELDAASNEIDHALSVLDHGLVVRSHTLRPALIRLHTFPPDMISSTLRTILPRRDLESLIRILHLELKNGGWSSSYDFVDSDDVHNEESTESPDDHAVTIVASLLSNTLDAIGAGAWVASVGSTSAESAEDMITSLHNDTSEALNGFWEARYMRGLVSEFLRYASTLPKSHKPSAEKLQGQNKPFPVTGKLEGEDLPMLPLGAKADLGIERAKKGHGGKQEQRSKREMGMLISKRVPKYSFERIVI